MSASKFSSSRSAQAWWAESSGRARASVAGTVAIVLALTTTSVFVWNSPDNPVREAVETAQGPSREQQLVAERNELLSQIVDLRGDLAAQSSDLDAIAADRAAIQKSLWKVEGELDSLKAYRVNNPQQFAAAATAPTATAKVTAPSRASLVTPKSSYLGMYTEQAPFNWATYDSTAKKLGSNPNVVGYFGGWDEKFRSTAVVSAWQRKKLPILTWEARPIAAANDVVVEPDYELSKILAGDFDTYLTNYAKDIVKTGLPMGIRLNHEMNGDWYPWSEGVNGNTQGEYVKVWRHVHDIFEKQGANKLVMWIWAPNIINNLAPSKKSYEYLAGLYPGDDYVDWVGVSAYLRPNYRADNDFTFSYTFDATLAQLRKVSDKPIFLAEIGASEIGGHKATWVSSLFEALEKPENSDVIGFSWFSLVVTSNVSGVRATNDWRIDSKSDTLAAFRDGLARPASRFALTAN